ncbi:methylenetetrahydrofolate reductase [Occultella glacieicola]|uniref:Methylenetetrahydrofolate reductase n=1 Tax=Occultella glacieicola TaxID=2518684 RepID=A0ABY2E802_9MICO|nr:methylenetetrahydrofolate reductase [Occultella glacieicola]TDE94842.1 methylenetetrahydrofolate reductase [Occultella glacieicola]
MSTASLYRAPSERPTISFELYPPRTPKGEASLQRTVASLADIGPDFFSVTYGASGATRQTSRDLLCTILRDTPITPIAHLTCVGASEADLTEYIDGLLEAGVRDFLALRGDPPAGQDDWRAHPDGLTRSSQLVALMRDLAARRLGPEDPVSISVAAYPGGSYSADGEAVVDPSDVAALLEKQEAGADFAITQVFFDPAHYAELVSAARAGGVRIPIVPGLIPLTDPKRLRRLEQLTGVPVPQRLLDSLDSAEDPDEAYRRGLAASVELSHGVLQAGAPGLHLYTFNSSRAVLDLLDQAGLTPTPAVARSQAR